MANQSRVVNFEQIAKLKALREKKGLSIRRACVFCRIPEQTWKRWECKEPALHNACPELKMWAIKRILAKCPDWEGSAKFAPYKD